MGNTCSGRGRLGRGFALTIDRAAGLSVDAVCSARTAHTIAGASDQHRRLVEAAIRHLEAAQLSLFLVRDIPFAEEARAREPQSSSLF